MVCFNGCAQEFEVNRSKITMHFFNRVTLQTPESVELEFTLAGIGNRALGLLIDYIALGLTLAVFALFWLFLSNSLIDLLVPIVGDAETLSLWLISIFALTSFAIYIGYFVFFETLWRGQTPGKRYTKIRVIRADGRPAGLAQATLRALLRPVDDTLFLGFILIILSSQERRLGDLAAGTLVVQEERTVAAASFPISEPAKQLATQLAQMADISQLSPDDFVVVREYLQRRRSMEVKARNQLSLELARQVKAVIELEKVPPETTSDLFLEAIYLAYQQQSPEVGL